LRRSRLVWSQVRIEMLMCSVSQTAEPGTELQIAVKSEIEA
jgi:hypothetical protein